MRKIIKNYWILLLVSAVVIILDQITKSIVRANLPFGVSYTPIEAIPFFRFVHWENTGAAFGMFQGGGTVFAILAVIVTIIIIVYYPQIPQQYLFMRIAVAMQMGGAIGNLIDRILFGPVLDFIAVSVFPVFNIADASITVGVAILLISLWVEERKQKETRHLSDNNNQDSFESLLDDQP